MPGFWPEPGTSSSHRPAQQQAPAPPGAGQYSVFSVTRWVFMLQHLPGGVKHTCLKHLERVQLRLIQITENREQQELIFSTDGLFSVSKIIFSVWRNP